MGEKAKLFVGGLPQDVTDEEIRITFGVHGPVADVHIMGGKSTSGQQCAFVCYEDFNAAEVAIATMDHIHAWREGDEKPINVRWAKAGGGAAAAAAQPTYHGGGGYAPVAVAAPVYVAPTYTPPTYTAPTYTAPKPVATQNKLFVGNIPPGTEQHDVQAVFGAYGHVTDCHLMQGKSTSGEMCAFVVMDSYEGAEAAIAALDSVHTFPGASSAIRVAWPKARGDAGGAAGGGYGGGGGYGQAAAPQQQYAAPQQYAPVQQYTPPQQQQQYTPPQQSYKGKGGGYGASYGAAPAPATYGAAAAGVPTPPPPVRAAPTFKLFVGNLPSDIAQEALQVVFGTYGAVINIHQMAGKSKSGQTCAFVEYGTQLEAETAVLTLHERYEIRPGDGPIVVKYANSGAQPAGGVRSSPY